MNKTQIHSNISNIIEDQFPRHYVEGTDPTNFEKSLIVDFAEAYYEFIENDYSENFLASRSMFTYRDIDTTLDDFVVYFKKKYLNQFSNIGQTDERFVIKNIMDLYRAKGNEKAIKLLFRLLFNKDATVYLPEQDILRADESIWVEPKFLELTRSDRTKQFLNKTITNASGASAFASKLVTKRVNGKIIDLLYLEGIRGTFSKGDLISDDGIFIDSPKVIGSLSALQILESDGGFSVGDILDVISQSGKSAKARVTSVIDSSTRIDISLQEGGYGYTLNSEVLTPDAVLFVNNANSNFKSLDNVIQPLYQFSVDANTGLFSIGDQVQANNYIGGTIVGVTGNTVLVESNQNDPIKYQQTLTLQSNSDYTVGEIIVEQSLVDLTVSNSNGTFTIGEIVYQKEDTGNGYINIATGTVTGSNASVISLSESFGTFESGLSITGVQSRATADIDSANVVSEGISAEVEQTSANSIVVSSFEMFTANTQIRGQTSNIIETIDSVSSQTIEQINVANTHTANVDSITDVSAKGKVIGQTPSTVVLNGNNNPFIFTGPTINNVWLANTAYEIQRIGRGSGANFEIDSIDPDTTSNVEIGTDVIDGPNSVGRSFLPIIIGTGENSGVGRVANTTIVSGGSGYDSNTTLTVSGGGAANQQPLIPAYLEPIIVSGEITAITIVDPGEGYVTTPTITVSGSGTGASVTADIESGYGFGGSPYVNFNSTIDQALSTEQLTIGEIASIKSINPGSDYDTDVEFIINENSVSQKNIYDYSVVVNSSDNFFVNEIVSSSNGAKGRIISISNNTLRLKNVYAPTRFETRSYLSGETSGANSEILFVNDLINNPQMGLNAVIDADVVVNSGTISQLSVSETGYGHVSNETVTVKKPGTNITAKATTTVSDIGADAGFWKTKKSHIERQKLHDNDYYQEYSYEIRSPISINIYKDSIKELLHVAGTKFFGRVVTDDFVEVEYTLFSENEFSANSEFAFADESGNALADESRSLILPSTS